MHRGEVVVTVHTEVLTVRAGGEGLRAAWLQVLLVGSYCKEWEQEPMSDAVFQPTVRPLGKKSGCNEYITPAVRTRHIFVCLFLRFKEYIHSELGRRSNGSTRCQTSLKVLWQPFEWARPLSTLLQSLQALTEFPKTSEVILCKIQLPLCIQHSSVLPARQICS